MIVDILMAFVIALLLEIFALVDLKKFMIFVFCFTIILIHIVTGFQPNFIGEIDLAIWIMLIIIFNEVIIFIINKIRG